ncbi:MAG: glycoside hydrolase family 2 protein [Phycisphaerae bacterium]
MQPQEIIDQLFDAARPLTVELAGAKTTLRPARAARATANPADHLRLNGTWSVRRWPFDRDEQELAGTMPRGPVETVLQPGKVFYQDPQTDPSTVENWNRVRLDHIDPDDGALLQKQVRVPSRWAGKKILLQFGAVYPGARFYINGQPLGEHLAGLIPFSAEVTDCVQPGEEALVAVRLLRKHEHVRFDMPRHAMEFAGISQDAMLLALAPCCVSEMNLRTILNDDNASGRVGGSIAVDNEQDTPAEGSLTVRLTDASGRQAAEAEQPVNVPAGGSTSLCLSLPVDSVRPWTDETPELYNLHVELDIAGQDSQRLHQRVGFKRMELIDQRPRLNGGFCKLRGVNWLTFSPEGGMATSRQWLIENLRMMKRCNINAIRTHFTAPPVLADLCDEMGFFLLQEITIDWVSEWLGEPAYLGPALQRVEATVRRDAHHVSLVAFCIGNENQPAGDDGIERFWQAQETFRACVKRLAPDSWTLVPPPGPANKIKHMLETRCCDIADLHYSFVDVRQLQETGQLTEPLSWESSFQTLSKQQLLDRGWSGVWFSSEWGLVNYHPDLLNAPYLSIIADRKENPLSGKNTQQTFLDRVGGEWQLMRDDPSCLGGAFFPWMCAGVGQPFGWTLWGEDADWGVVTHELQAKASFWALRRVYRPVVLSERVSFRPGQASLQLQVRNLYHTRDLADVTFRTMMGPGGRFMAQMRRWQDVSASCPPGGQATIDVPIWNEQTRKDLESGLPAICRCIILEASGYRPITHDVLIVPEGLDETDSHVVIGPDANLASI